LNLKLTEYCRGNFSGQANPLQGAFILISVVIPAHNEESVIGRCLSRLTSDGYADQLQIIVVCNGCSDKTAEVAGRFSHVEVVSIETASKIAALNTGDQHAKHFPIAYVDADINITGKDLILAAYELSDRVQVVAPRVIIDLTGSSWLVKSFYSVWMQLPYFSTNHMVGSGVFILSEKGRSRFGPFPNLISDDGYVRSLFESAERKTTDGCSFTVYAPRDIKSLLKIKTRVRLGNMQVMKLYPHLQVGGENTSTSFVRLLLRKPWLVPSGIVYVCVQWITKRRSVARLHAQTLVWDRDNSSRTSQ
jgi:glycosyltransferase involved in cell wall biosynthesis